MKVPDVHRAAGLTCSIEGSSIAPAPRQVRDGDSDGPTAEQHVVSNRAPDSCHGCVDARQLTAPQLRVTEQNPRHTLRGWTPQPRVDECHRQSWGLLELDQVVEPAVTHPGVVMETWGRRYKWGYRRKDKRPAVCKVMDQPADGWCGCWNVNPVRGLTFNS